MIYPDHARPGDLVPSLALDAARSLLPRLDLNLPDLSADAVHRTLKEALEWGKLPRFHAGRWTCVQDYAKATLSAPAQEQLLGWFRNAYTGYHAANPDLSHWSSFMVEMAHVPGARYQLSLDATEQDAFDHLLQTFAREQDAEGLEEQLDHLRGLKPSAWDRKLLTRYEMVYFDRETGSDPFLVIKQANKAQALRRTLRLCAPGTSAEFPLERVNQYAEALMIERGSWFPPGTGLCGLQEVV